MARRYFQLPGEWHRLNGVTESTKTFEDISDLTLTEYWPNTDQWLSSSQQQPIQSSPCDVCVIRTMMIISGRFHLHCHCYFPPPISLQATVHYRRHYRHTRIPTVLLSLLHTLLITILLVSHGPTNVHTLPSSINIGKFVWSDDWRSALPDMRNQQAFISVGMWNAISGTGWPFFRFRSLSPHPVVSHLHERAIVYIFFLFHQLDIYQHQRYLRSSSTGVESQEYQGGGRKRMAPFESEWFDVTTLVVSILETNSITTHTHTHTRIRSLLTNPI